MIRVGADEQDPSTSHEENEEVFQILEAHKDYIRRVINNTDKLLAEASALFEDHEQLLVESEKSQSNDMDDSVIFVAENASPETRRRRKRLKVNTEPKVVIDISDSPPPGSPEAEAASNQPNQRKWGDCPICLENLGTVSISATVCGHTFCSACIKAAVAKDKKCPNCRKKLSVKQIVPLYL